MKKNKLVSLLTRWEVFLIILLALMCLVFNLQDATRVASGEARRDVFNVANVVRSMRPYMLYSFMTLGMMLILAMGDMDISVGAAATLSVVVLGVTYNALTTAGLIGLPALILSLAACLLVGSLCGALNGFLVTRFKELFPMIITLATQLFFRGFSYLLIGGQTLTFDDETFDLLKELNSLTDMFGIKVPVMLPIFLVVALVFYFWLHLTGNGRKIFAIGTNAIATQYSGVRVDFIKFWCFVVAGLMSAVTGVFFVGATSSSIKADIMDGYHMYAIAAAILGGFSTDGGKGSVIGAILSLIIFAVMKIGLGTLFGFADSAVNLSVGIILILSVLLPNMVNKWRDALRVRRRRSEVSKAA
ncbi:MAG TPA: ABC transporter permease [Candidatus Pullichristensenella stercorigallinarum]|uniref:Autoinducer 2 import system permease protein LsrD n=1 Tax=Candidatus Pullichristensenella stercorigallinarum TaxID=2840909 RepID=A0A9D0ZKZ5_9FIRM|nr:ABC transporter permease [Candidatus Pullichristensenella stercorigallinarum]